MSIRISLERSQKKGFNYVKSKIKETGHMPVKDVRSNMSKFVKSGQAYTHGKIKLGYEFGKTKKTYMDKNILIVKGKNPEDYERRSTIAGDIYVKKQKHTNI